MTKQVVKINKRNTELDLAKKRFAETYALTGNRREAMKAAFPHLMARSSNAYIRLKAYRLMMNDNVITEIDKQQAKLAELGGKSLSVIEDIMDVGQEHNALDAAKFTYEQIHGKARQTTEVIGKYVTVTYNLGGDEAPPVPKEVLDQLAED